MKKLILFIFLLFLAIITDGQTLKDQQEVIQTCIDLEDLKQYLHADKINGKKTLIIFNDGVVSPELVLTKFGEPVQFMNSETLFFYDKSAFLDFERFEISQDTAEVFFLYEIEGISANVSFEKVKGKWKVLNSKIKKAR
jgi:hypothetical protein